VTYKILFNDAVAMTGGQKNDGGLTVPQIAQQVAAEGVKRIAVVTDETWKYPRRTPWPKGTTIHHRDTLDDVQRDLAATPGCTVLIYDQTCAAEKRRRRKRGLFPDPDKRIVINELVCEGCGDCGVQSNCVSIQPRDIEFGRKRAIDQSSCNKDYSCVKGFCPSFVSVIGAKLKKGRGIVESGESPLLPEPKLPKIDQTYNVIVTGIGGTGIVTIGAIIGMAAHLDRKGVGIIDMAGLAQKGGSVHSHIRIAERPEDIHAIRVAARGADLVLGGDIVIAGGKKVLAAVKPGVTQMVVNLTEVLPGEFTRNADFSLPSERLKRTIAAAAGLNHTHFVDASRIATALLGQSIGANFFLLGYAYQIGAVPLSGDAIETAIALNGEAVAMNQAAFNWGRRAAIDLPSVEALIKPAPDTEDRARRLSRSFEEMVARRVDYLTTYQNAAYAARYRALVERARAIEAEKTPGRCGLAEAVARYLFKLMAYKDEYEVARLYSDGSFLRQVKNEAATAEELFQDVWMRVIDSRGRYEARAKFSSWVYAIAHNRLMDFYRASGKAKFLDQEENEAALDALPADDPPAEIRLDRKRAAERLLAALGRLPEAQREAFLLQQEGELSVEEIGAVTGVSRETAKSRLRYALVKLRSTLTNEP